MIVVEMLYCPERSDDQYAKRWLKCSESDVSILMHATCSLSHPHFEAVFTNSNDYLRLQV